MNRNQATGSTDVAVNTDEPTALAFTRSLLRDGTPEVSATIVRGLIDIIDYDRRLIAGLDARAARAEARASAAESKLALIDAWLAQGPRA